MFKKTLLAVAVLSLTSIAAAMMPSSITAYNHSKQSVQIWIEHPEQSEGFMVEPNNMLAINDPNKSPTMPEPGKTKAGQSNSLHLVTFNYTEGTIYSKYPTVIVPPGKTPQLIGCNGSNLARMDFSEVNINVYNDCLSASAALEAAQSNAALDNAAHNAERLSLIQTEEAERARLSSN